MCGFAGWYRSFANRLARHSGLPLTCRPWGRGREGTPSFAPTCRIDCAPRLSRLSSPTIGSRTDGGGFLLPRAKRLEGRFSAPRLLGAGSAYPPGGIASSMASALSFASFASSFSRSARRGWRVASRPPGCSAQGLHTRPGALRAPWPPLSPSPALPPPLAEAREEVGGSL
eukprot:CAMPEP_0181226500 /NCGR_PEP_ID=MMETSP1096-20121128/32290_1 /TAXON_ID=156174 ORGANISM="Chrysochromulina ericina, Strain CCMP281" /NCGR_SAMPLE_ID=MMETSP1096 /ASSEMBLY_ACC=CAM_ASM_000453 /LENGTH=170 /DNA_ID=CAMNT_0023319847 /DNA_START=756 /DNA_END=1265 /DNA_ORIENTATION=-